MKDYSAMTDFEINKEVALKLGVEWSAVTDGNRIVYHTNDFCNNPADAWPIIHDNRIGISPSGEIWHAYSSGEDFVCSISNPLRAAMIVYLMMKDAEKCDG